ncbi:MAG: exodeoxyribonuclease VII large subunit [Acidobacteriia bacterium]|nr:exodeoxyribonuclease VII large subunit [Terriglobia bacterium]
MSLPDQLGFTFQAPARRIWTVRDLMSAVRSAVEREYTDVFVEGEISNYRPAESGHLYFTLKEDGAQMRVVMFRSQARLLRFKPADGMAVIARGRVTVYETRGELQLSAQYLEPRGAGALQIAFEQLKQKLAAEGLFDPARKRPIPALPRRIGVVTSPRGAAIRDIVNIVQRRHRGLNVLIYPAQVQGEAAAGEVSAGIQYFNRAGNVDVVVVARGGGSMEDLAAFNDEGLARVAAASELPLISAIGHETDFTILDFVADLRAPTPSAAAELVIESQHQLEQRVETFRQRLARAARYQLLMARQTLTQLAQHGAFARMHDLIGRRQQRLDELVFRLASAERRRLHEYRTRLDTASARVRARDLRRTLDAMRRDLDAHTSALASAARSDLARRRARFEGLRATLEALSPLSILERGYALVFDARGNLVKDARQVKPGNEIRARVSRGTIAATVKKTTE